MQQCIPSCLILQRAGVGHVSCRFDPSREPRNILLQCSLLPTGVMSHSDLKYSGSKGEWTKPQHKVFVLLLPLPLELLWLVLLPSDLGPLRLLELNW